jgi:acetate kinase
MKILCLNCGSSSVKYRLFDWEAENTLATGIVERVGIGRSFIQHELHGKHPMKVEQDCPTHKDAVALIVKTLTHPDYGVLKDLGSITAVGHRMVHGGERFARSVLLGPESLAVFKELSDLAPLHNPPNILGYEAAKEVLPDIPHVGIMDTAWHQTMPKHAYIYSLPYEWYEKYGVRRYGFHGTSFLYVAKRAAVLLGKDPFKCNLVMCHIGNGVSVNAVKDGCSYDTSMGMTPLEGLVMGTRAGDHDPAIDLYIMGKEGKSPKEMDSVLNKKSGLIGITGRFVDRRDIEEAANKGDERCQLAIEIESYRLKKYIGAYAAAVGGVDAVVFTAGVGEMSALIRAKALDGLEFMGIKYDKAKNELSRTRYAETDITAAGSKAKVFVIPTDEERVFIEDVVATVSKTYDVHTNFTYRFQLPEYRNPHREEEFEMQCEDGDKELRKIVAKVPKQKVAAK